MTKRSATASRILDAARKLFNVKGYSATSVTEIAASLGISQGNLTYHFKTKQALAMAIEDELLQLVQRRRAAATPGSLADDYIEHVMFGMEVTWRFRFVLRDRPIYAGEPIGQRSDSQLTADLDDLRRLLERMASERMFIRGAVDDLESLARSLWMVSRPIRSRPSTLSAPDSSSATRARRLEFSRRRRRRSSALRSVNNTSSCLKGFEM